MGYIRHHAIIVSGRPDEDGPLRKVHRMLKTEIGVQTPREGVFRLNVSEIVVSNVEVTGSFLVAPDGSKEGWNTSDYGNEWRNVAICLLKEQGYHLDWAEVQYGDDEGNNIVLRHSDEDYQKDLQAEVELRNRGQK